MPKMLLCLKQAISGGKIGSDGKGKKEKEKKKTPALPAGKIKHLLS